MANGMPVATLGYTYEDEDGLVQIGATIWLSFYDDMLTNLVKMEKKEKEKGFMFWNISPEGEKFFTENWKVIGSSITNIVLNQK